MSAVIEKAIIIGLLLVIVFTALAFGAVEPWSMAVLEVLVTLLAVLWVCQIAAQGYVAIYLPATTYPLLAFLLLGLVQSITWTDAAGVRHGLSADPEATRLTLLLLVVLFLAFLLFANFLATRERLEAVATFLIFYGLLLAVFSLVQHFTWNGKFYWLIATTSRGFGPFVNRNHFAGYLEMIVPLAAAVALLREKQTEKRVLYGFTAAIIGAAIIVSLSRGGMVSLTASLLLLVTLGLTIGANSRPSQRARLSRLAQIGAGAVVTIAIAAGVFWLGVEPVIERVAGKPGEATRSVSEALRQDRGFIWLDSLAMFKAYPLLGVGLGAYQTVYPTYSSHDTARLPVGHAHNDYLQVLTDSGLIGGGLALWFILLLLRDVQRGLRQPQHRLAVLALGGGGGLFALLIHSFFDFNLQIPSNALLFLLLTALAARLGEAGQRPVAVYRQ